MAFARARTVCCLALSAGVSGCGSGGKLLAAGVGEGGIDGSSLVDTGAGSSSGGVGPVDASSSGGPSSSSSGSSSSSSSGSSGSASSSSSGNSGGSGSEAGAGDGSGVVSPQCPPGCCGQGSVDAGSSARTIVADSVSGFSGTQGKCGWSFGYLPTGAEPFTLLTVYDTTQYVRTIVPNGPVWEESTAHPPWLITFDTAQHPNESPLQWNDRRWVSTVAGTIAIDGHLGKTDSSGGDGVVGHIRVGGSDVWTASIPFDDTTGVDFSLAASVSIGTPIDFVIDPLASDLYDTTTMTAVISQ